MIHGIVHPAFTGVVDMLRRTLPSRGRPGGAAVCVYHRGEKVVDVWAGTRNQAGDPWEEDTVSISFSTTKDAFREYWAQYGELAECELMFARDGRWG